MERKKLELNLALILAILLLWAILFIFSKKEVTPPPGIPSKGVKEGLKREKAPLIPPQAIMHGQTITAGKGTTKKEVPKEPEEKETHHIMLLKDLPLDEVQTDKEMASEMRESVEITSPYQTRPSADDIKKLKEKGLIIY